MSGESSRSCSVHPRVRGDGLPGMMVVSAFAGSPPRARGRYGQVARVYLAGRFTPACAGTVLPPTLRWQWTAVHPRVRGDGGKPNRLRPNPNGSPPRARGRFSLCGRLPRRRRFTPACAGTVHGLAAYNLGLSVHPRVRGDGSEFSQDVDIVDGSPPRARGRSGPAG